MDDYNVSSLNNSQHEWAVKLLNTITPYIVEGVESIFNEAYNLCKNNGETDKYLMTFQNLLSRIPKWNNSIIKTETERIVERSKCLYLEDLISCVHISHLKILTSIRVGKSQKKININIPNLNEFIHKIYINCGRKLYTTVYLFEKSVEPLVCQKNKKEIEDHVQTCILNTIRDSIPVEEILRAYMDESTDLVSSVQKEEQPKKDPSIENMSNTEPTTRKLEADTVSVSVPEKDEVDSSPKETPNHDTVLKLAGPEPPNSDNVEPEIVKNTQLALPSSQINLDIKKMEEPIKSETNETSLIKFSEIDNTIDVNKKIEDIAAPKDIQTLEKISTERHNQRKQEEEEDDDDEKISISNESIKLDTLDINDVLPSVKQESLLTDVEVLV